MKLQSRPAAELTRPPGTKPCCPAHARLISRVCSHLKLPAWLQIAHPAPAVLAPAGGDVAGTVLADAADRALLATALESLNDQMHEVIDRNADGVNRAAVSVRRETDMLLALGISDALAAKAGSYAQMALELANTGRGVNLQAVPHHLTAQERADLVARAMTLMMRAEMLMAAAKKSNLANIGAALARQEQLVNRARETLLVHQA